MKPEKLRILKKDIDDQPNMDKELIIHNDYKELIDNNLKTMIDNSSECWEQC